jgi:hypothetical protein
VIPPIVLKVGTIGLILGACWLHGCHYGEQRISKDYATYRINVESVGKAAQAAADAEKALNEARKAASDASYAKALGVLGRDIGELRKRTSSGAYDLPAPAPSATCPQGQRCFDRDGFDAALRDFEGEVLTLVGEGATLKLRMDEAITWANRLSP